jgi:molybdopterin molybdotransferase
MLEFEDARRRILESSSPVDSERVDLWRALGRILREDLAAAAPLPPFDYSAMDGYCLSCTALQGEPPFELPVAGESRTGHPCPPLPEGACLRIFTGARLPAGADGVIIQENTERLGERVRLLTRPNAGDHVRRRGEDLKQGEVGLASGTRLGPFQLGLAAALDRSHLLVSQKPRVLVLPTGDELRAPGGPGSPDAIPESNSVALAGLAALAGAEVEVAPRLPDDLDTAAAAITRALERADVLVTVGGVSVGDHDLVRPAFARAGVALDFWKVRIQPGKPLAFGRHGRAFVLGLPGNPVSAQVTFFLFGLPLLRALQGDRSPLPRETTIELAKPLKRKPGRLGVYRATLDGVRATLHDNQSSGATTSLAHADALVLVPAELAECGAGKALQALRLDAG